VKPLSDSEKSSKNGTRPTIYHISIVAQMVETHPQTLRTYERMGLVNPQRTSNNVRLIPRRMWKSCAAFSI
jgi:MerR family transcriptional regulator/heat shock protein HspR